MVGVDIDQLPAGVPLYILRVVQSLLFVAGFLLFRQRADTAIGAHLLYLGLLPLLDFFIAGDDFKFDLSIWGTRSGDMRFVFIHGGLLI